VLTVTTGAGLWGWPGTVGEAFAWEIRSPLTAAWMGAWYVAAAAALVQAALARLWVTARIVMLVAFTLTTTSLIATVRFFDEFRLGEGSSASQLIAWVWLGVYVALPPITLAAFVLHQRRCEPADRRLVLPILLSTRAVVISLLVASASLGVWLTASPGKLAGVWPWTLSDLSASIVGTWLLTVAVGCAWALRDAEWRRFRFLAWPFVLVLVLHLISLARLENTIVGSTASIVVYAAAVGLTAVALAAVGAVEERRVRGQA
jgi:hypothetical protein